MPDFFREQHPVYRRKRDRLLCFLSGSHPYDKDKFTKDATADAYRCPMGKLMAKQKRKKDGQICEYSNEDACAACTNSGLCTKAKDGVRRIQRDMEQDTVREKAKGKADSEAGREILRLRKSVPDPVWGNIKTIDGLTQMHYRGMNKASQEIKLHSVMHNIRKIIKVYFHSESYQETIHQTEDKSYANTA